MTDRDLGELLQEALNQINDPFAEPQAERAPTPAEVKKHRAASNQRHLGQRVSYQKPKNVNLALLAKNDDMAGYYKARQSSRR
jgi:hypothetical protein